jgi:hypothetical protein
MKERMRYLYSRYLNAKTAKLFYILFYILILIALLALVLVSGALLRFGEQGGG